MYIILPICYLLVAICHLFIASRSGTLETTVNVCKNVIAVLETHSASEDLIKAVCQRVPLGRWANKCLNIITYF